ncbi:hypothetical protein KGQ71_03435 [Patescibacteria group bacterium]|nr:hypothetical protein [Patescibacteria group bacterium]
MVINKQTALLSVYNKEGIVDFARRLKRLGWEILASGGTAKTLQAADIPVQDVGELVGEPILGHRVVTLSREIHAGLLAQDTQADRSELKKLRVPFIDLVCVDLYPLQAEIDRPDSTPESVREKTDIGGPAMLRSAAKGQRIVICDPADRDRVAAWLEDGAPEKERMITELAAKAEAVVARYGLASARYHGSYDGLLGRQVLECQYGENGWQAPAGLYSTGSPDRLALDRFTRIAGTTPSYNNLCDLDRLLQTMTHLAAAFDRNYGTVPAIALGAKHGNCCGAAVGEPKKTETVLKKMIDGDKRAIFGGLVMVNFPVDRQSAEILLSYGMPEGSRRLLDGIIAPSFADEAVELLRRKGDKCRFLANPALAELTSDSLDISRRFRYVRGGFLAQPNYELVLDLKDPDLQKSVSLPAARERDLLLAWAIGSTSNSNTVTLTRNGSLLGNGVGQQDRVGGCELAIKRATDAGHTVDGCVAYSDSFFPFPDGPEVLADAGVTAILATGGSVKDAEVQAVCRKRGVTLYLAPDKRYRGFFGH